MCSPFVDVKNGSFAQQRGQAPLAVCCSCVVGCISFLHTSQGGVQELVDHCARQGKPKVVEAAVMHMDIVSLDLNQVV